MRETLHVSPSTPTDWAVFGTPGGFDRVGIELDCPALRADVVMGTKCDRGGVVDDAAGGRFAFLRMPSYDVHVPLEGAPTWWVRRAKREGFCFALPPAKGDQVPYIVTTMPPRETVPVVGRNQPCSCGSERKYKRCHGAVDA